MSGRDSRAAPGITRRLKLITYNIHSGVGVDKRYDLGRIRRVLNDERPHVAALQELECRSRRTSYDDQSSVLASDLALTSLFCATRPAVGLELPILALNRELDNVAGRPTPDLR